MKIYEIKWIDAESFCGWQCLNDIDKALKRADEPIVSIGYIIKRTDKFIVMTSGLREGKLPTENDDCSIFDYTFIPVKWILSKRILGEN